MKEIEFCKKECRDISLAQEVWIKEYVAKKAFVGVGRAFGCFAVMPLVLSGGGYYVIDSQASLLPASTASIIRYQEQEES